MSSPSLAASHDGSGLEARQHEDAHPRSECCETSSLPLLSLRGWCPRFYRSANPKPREEATGGMENDPRWQAELWPSRWHCH